VIKAGCSHQSRLVLNMVQTEIHQVEAGEDLMQVMMQVDQ
jgi:hypothetical protein